MSIGRMGFVLLLLVGCAVAQTPAYVQSNFSPGAAGAVSTQSVSLSAGVGYGDAIVVALGYVNGSDDFSSCSDSAGNSYSLAKAATNGSNLVVDGAVAINLKPNQFITVTCKTVSTHTFFSLQAAEYSSVYSLSQPDATASLPSCAACTSFSFTITTNIANDMVIVLNNASGALGTVTPGSGYTSDNNSGNPCNEYKVTAGTGSQTANCSWTTSKNLAVIAIALKAGTPPAAPSTGNFVNSCQNETASGATVHSLTCTFTVGAHHKLIMSEEVGNGAFNVGTPVITNSNSWSLSWSCPVAFGKQTAVGGINNYTDQCWVDTGSNSGTNTFTVSPSGAGPDYMWIGFFEYMNAGSFDVAAYETSTGATSSTNSITTTGASDIIIQLCRWSSNATVSPPPTLSAGSGLTLDLSDNNFFPLGYFSGATGTSAGMISESRVANGAGTYSPACSSTSNGAPWSLAALAFTFTGGGFSYSQVF